jgi:uncharacterized protein YjbI with pentapeptide repeats
MIELTDSQKQDQLRAGKPLQFDSSTADGVTAAAKAGSTIQARWLEALAEEPDRIVRVPIRITNAVIEGPLRLAYATFEYDLSIRDSIFTDEVDLSYATFKRTASFEGSQFIGPAKFREAHVIHDLHIKGTTFPDGSVFNDLQIEGVLGAWGATFGSVVYTRPEDRRPVRFERVQVGKNAFFGLRKDQKGDLVPARFTGEVSFRDAHIKVNANFQSAEFYGIAHFDRMKIDGAATFSPARFDDAGHRITGKTWPVTFSTDATFEEARFGGSAFFNGVRFGGTANFRGAQFGSQAQFGAVRVGDENLSTCFEGEANFRRARIHDVADFQGARFNAVANFWLLRVDGSALFSAVLPQDSQNKAKTSQNNDQVARTCFRGEANFFDGRIEGSADFNGVQFGQRTTFNRLRVGGVATFMPFWNDQEPIPVKFGGETSFIDCHVHGLATFEGAEFAALANFNRLQVDGNVFFRAARQGGVLQGTRFLGEANFLEARFGGTADFDGAQFVTHCNFRRVQIGGDAFFRTVREAQSLSYLCFGGDAFFDGARIGGTAYFHGAQFLRQAHFSGAYFGRDIFFQPLTVGGRTIRNYFCGEAQFIGAQVQGDAVIESARFLAPVDFQSVHVAGNALLRGRHTESKVLPLWFCGETKFLGADIEGIGDFSRIQSRGRFTFTGCHVGGETLFSYSRFDHIAEFIGARFESQGQFRWVRFKKEALFNRAQIKGSAFFQGTIFNGPVNFFEAGFDSVFFHTNQPQGGQPQDEVQFQDRVDLRGFTYVNISVHWERLLDKLSPYDRQPYNQLEKFLRSAGNDREAGYVYLKRRKEERRRLWQLVRRRDTEDTVTRWQAFRETPRLGFDVIQHYLFRYGIRPFRLLWLSILSSRTRLLCF